MKSGGGVVEKVCAVDGECGDGVSEQAVAVGVARQVLDGAACAALDVNAGASAGIVVVEAGDVFEKREIAVGVEEDSIDGVVVGGDGFGDQAGGAAGGVEPITAAVEGEEADLHEVGIVEVNQIFVGVVGDGGGELGDLGGVGGSAESEAAIGAQADAGLGGADGGVDHRIRAGIDVQRCTGGELVGAENVDRIRFWRGGELAVVAIGADGERGVLIVHIRGVVNVIGVAVFGDSEIFGAAIDDGVVAGE